MTSLPMPEMDTFHALKTSTANIKLERGIFFQERSFVEAVMQHTVQVVATMKGTTTVAAETEFNTSRALLCVRAKCKETPSPMAELLVFSDFPILLIFPIFLAGVVFTVIKV